MAFLQQIARGLKNHKRVVAVELSPIHDSLAELKVL
jgi:hypothetical protein